MFLVLHELIGNRAQPEGDRLPGRLFNIIIPQPKAFEGNLFRTIGLGDRSKKPDESGQIFILDQLAVNERPDQARGLCHAQVELEFDTGWHATLLTWSRGRERESQV